MLLVVGMTILAVGVARGETRPWTVRLAAPAESAEPLPPGARENRVKAVDRARATFERARLAGAEYAAPFEYHMAREYLALAQEELKEGDRIGVQVFAAKSEVYAGLAARRTAGGAR